MGRKSGFVRLASFYLLVAALFLIGTFIGNKAVTTFAQQDREGEHHCIVIDAGHGGEDGGAVSCTGTNESSFNLAIAIKTNNVLQLLGYKTKMIRTEDVSVSKNGTTVAQRKASDLRERARMVNETWQAVLLSIHQNYYQEEKYSGAQVFYGKSGNSRELAEKMQENLCLSLNKNNHRKIKKADGIYIMENTQCPGVLIECGFISNSREEMLLKTEAYQKKIAAAIAATIAAYLENA